MKEPQETWFRSLCWEDSLEEETATHYTALAWRIPWTEEPDRLQSMGLQRVRHDWATKHVSVQFSSVAQSCPALCDPMDCSMPGSFVRHQFLELAQTHVHWVSDAIQPSYPLSTPSPLTFNLSQHQGSSVHGTPQARILEWVAMPSSKRSSQPRDQTQVSHIAGGFFTIWAIRGRLLIEFY